ncbi:MAG: helicase HerA-like domain-containing protein [Hyphomicrobiaceae bacterium]
MLRLKVMMLGLLLAAMSAIALIDQVAIDWYPLAGTAQAGRAVAYAPGDIRDCMGARALSTLGDATSTRLWNACAASFARTGSLAGFTWRYWTLVASCALVLVSLLGFAFALHSDRASARVIRGRRLKTGDDGRRAFLRSSRAECRQSGAGLELLPGLAVSRERESRHWLIWGSVGAGKTQTMLHLILAATARGDGVLVLDVKGDMTAGLPGEPQLIAPQDRRSLVWDVARDCRTKQDARELAARLIPKSVDPMWSDAARDILVVCVAALQATQGERWSWSDLHTIATSDAETLLRMAQAHHVDAVRLLETPDSRTAQSVLSTFQAHMHVVATLADAWRASTNGGFSISDWLKKPTPFRPVILQHDGRYPELSNAWIGGMLALLASAVGSPSLAESRERRIWIFADEFPQLPRLSHFSTFLDLGRSKGVITVIGAQDIAQLRATYGHERADAWVGMIGTKIITRINAGRGAEEASALIGDQEIERVERSETMVGGKSSVTTMRRREIRRVVTASEIATRLGPRRDGIAVLLLGLGDDVLELTVPYVTLPQRRPGHVPAQWSVASPATAADMSKPTKLHVVTPLSKHAAKRIREIGE